MSTVSENKLMKRMKILDAAYELFTESSVNSTAISDVVRLAGVAKGTFYLYFKDKYDLLDQIIIKKTSAVVTDAINELEKKRKTENITFADEIMLFLDYITDFMKKNKKIAVLINKNFSACFKCFAMRDDNEIKDTFNFIIKIFTENGYDEDTAKKTIYIIISLFGSVICDAILGEMPYSLEEIRPMLKTTIRKILE